MTMMMRIVIVTMSKLLYFNGNYNGNYYVTEIRKISVYYYYDASGPYCCANIGLRKHCMSTGLGGRFAGASLEDLT